ncbi:MAG: B12-binding domain-containing radical SAM protein [Deltaproteobacteria bacterium]|nr:MAG: B12-binding domain-containing radical SAM protein [Deltaproteobacteria bacterium]
MRTILATLHSKFIHNSLALPCLAAYCGNDCGELLIREFTVHEPRESILAMLLDEEPDIIAFSVYIWNRHTIFELIDALTVANPELRVIVGGPEVSFDGPEIFDRHPGLTALVRGEGEEPLHSLLTAWHQERQPGAIPRIVLRKGTELISGPDSPPLTDLNQIPSPFQIGLMDLERGFVYYETSRGCPFHCSFCLSARDNHMRSYSMERIYSDLLFLMQNKVPKIKLVDRTFNFDAERTRDIFSFILEHNLSTHFHFEIAGHLLDEQTLELLESVPVDTFQFEIGVQTTLERTLAAIDRRVNLTKLEKNIRHLRKSDRIHLHLDLVAGLPGDRYDSFLASIDQVVSLAPHHLQIEPVKLLPGSPLRDQAVDLQIRHDPNPPYTVLASKEMSFAELQKLQEISRLIDLTYNSGCFQTFLQELSAATGSFATGLTWLANEWHQRDLFRFPLSRQAIFQNVFDIIQERDKGASQVRLVEGLAYDYARCERIVTNRIPAFFDTELASEEQQWVQRTLQEKIGEIKGQGIKLQYFATTFTSIHDLAQRTVYLFCYLTETGQKMRVDEYRFNKQPLFRL